MKGLAMKKGGYAIPEEIRRIPEALEQKGFEAYLVGGCVRDLLQGIAPKDWDATTNAKPEEIIAAFPKTFYENSYGTVGVVNEDVLEDDAEKASLRVVEVTPYRTEGKYSDFRRPDEITFAKTLEEDLERRDFTMNAIAYSVTRETFIDPYGGMRDIELKVVRAVGDPHARFQEDALRLMRAVRLANDLSFTIEDRTMLALKEHAPLLGKIALERIADELNKIVMGKNPMKGIIMLHDVGLLKYILPEMEEGIACEQNGDHIYDVWEHNLRALQHSADRGWPLHVRLAAMLHDVSKPETRRWAEEKKDWTFYGHDVVGGRVSEKILTRLKYSNDIIKKVSTLVRYHLFFSDIEKITLSAVRRIVRNVGPELVWDLMDVRSCDRIGMGRPKETPYRLRKYHSMIEEAMRAPVSVAMLKTDGKRIMELLGEKPSIRLGWILHALLEEVLDDPTKNTEGYLDKKTKELSTLPEKELRALGEEGKEKKSEAEEAELKEIRNKYGVK
jgi:tRNA nucleotidyltransferase (CCA-adding enzyme)